MSKKNKNDLFNETVKLSSQATTGKDRGFINKKAESTMTLRESGTVTLNSGIYAQFKCDKNSGVTSETAIQSVSNTVQRELTTSDLIINRHKFNTQLFEFTNLKSNMGTVMGDLTVNTTILVKAWEPTLQQWVLIRRPARFPVFGNLLDAYIVDDRLEVSQNMSEDILEMMRNINDLTIPKEKSDE